jgi:hypothetical protein
MRGLDPSIRRTPGLWIRLADPDNLARRVDPVRASLDHALTRYRASCAAKPNRLFVTPVSLTDRSAGRISKAVATEATYGDPLGLYSPHDRPHHADDLHDGLASQARLDALQERCVPRFSSQASLREMSNRSEYSMKAGDMLGSNNHGRRLVSTLYLTPGWDPSFARQLLGRDGALTTIEQATNSLVILDANAQKAHRFQTSAPQAGAVCRRDVGGWIDNPTSNHEIEPTQ